MVNQGSGGGGGGGSQGGSQGGSGQHHQPGGGNSLQILNPPFDHRMRMIGSPSQNPGGIKRGWIQTANDASGNAQGPNGKCRINFLFNPSTLVANHSISPTQPSLQQTKSNENRVPGDIPFYASTGSSIGFSLLFDRTYDLWTKRGVKPTLASTFGVAADVAAFYYYFGMIPQPAEAALYGPSHISEPGDPAPPVLIQKWSNLSPSRPPAYFGSYIYIGDKLTYYGVCTSFNVTYTHWNHEMVPMRCSIDLSWQLLVDPSTTEKWRTMR